MNVPNHERKAFKDMTQEERSAIVDAVINNNAEYWSGEFWCKHGNDAVFVSTVYRTRPRQLVIPWEHIKPVYKWAALDSDWRVYFYIDKPEIGGISWGGGDYTGAGALNIDTTGIDWRESLTQRPE